MPRNAPPVDNPNNLTPKSLMNRAVRRYANNNLSESVASTRHTMTMQGKSYIHDTTFPLLALNDFDGADSPSDFEDSQNTDFIPKNYNYVSVSPSCTSSMMEEVEVVHLDRRARKVSKTAMPSKSNLKQGSSKNCRFPKNRKSKWRHKSESVSKSQCSQKVPLVPPMGGKLKKEQSITKQEDKRK